MKITEIINFLQNGNYDVEFRGDEYAEIEGFCQLSELKNNSVTWIKKIKNFKFDSIDKNLSILFICNKGNVPDSYNYIFCDNPKEIFFSILTHFYAWNEYPPETKKSAIVESDDVHPTAYIGHNTFIGSDVKIGANVVIKNNVSIEGKVIIGEGCLIHSGVVIGTDGFGYFKDKEGINTKVPHFGGVTIGKNVEIGANTCIDRGTIGETEIGDYVKIDNLCHIAHNVKINKNVSMCALSVICGSVTVGENAYIAPGAIINSQINIGGSSMAGIGAVVLHDVESNNTVFGNPAKVIWSK